MAPLTSSGEQPLYDGIDETGMVQTDEQDAMLDASRKIALICADLIDAGLNEQIVAEAMMGATIQFYDAAGLTDTIPDILRRRADSIQQVLLNKDVPHN